MTDNGTRFVQAESHLIRLVNSTSDWHDPDSLVAVTYVRPYFSDWVVMVRWLANMKVGEVY